MEYGDVIPIFDDMARKRSATFFDPFEAGILSLRPS